MQRLKIIPWSNSIAHYRGIAVQQLSALLDTIIPTCTLYLYPTLTIRHIVQNNYSKNSIVIFLAKNDFNEEEYLSVRKVFEKSGKRVFVVSDSNYICSGEKGLKVGADLNLFNVNEKNFASIVIVGGKGISEYKQNESLKKILQNFHYSGKTVAAICIAPTILAYSGILNSLSATCWPQCKNELISLGIHYKDTNIVNEKNIITASGPDSAVQFAETILNMIK